MWVASYLTILFWISTNTTSPKLKFLLILGVCDTLSDFPSKLETGGLPDTLQSRWQLEIAYFIHIVTISSLCLYLKSRWSPIATVDTHKKDCPKSLCRKFSNMFKSQRLAIIDENHETLRFLSLVAGRQSLIAKSKSLCVSRPYSRMILCYISSVHSFQAEVRIWHTLFIKTMISSFHM